MRSFRFPRRFAVCACAGLMLLVTLTATANNGRAFSGYFDVSDVHEQGEFVQVTLHLQLFNQGDSDIKGAIVALVDSNPAVTLRGSFRPVKLWKRNQPIRLSQQFTITKREYGEWMTLPAPPNLLVLFQDAKGQNWTRTAQISRRPLLP